MARRMVAPDKHVKETVVGNRSYKPNKQGIYNVSNYDAKAMKAEGFFEASLMGPTQNSSLGYTCVECGFGSWFKLCSRCGNDNGSGIKTDGD